MRVPLFRWQHRLHRWTSHALLLSRHGPARRDSDAPTHRGARPPSGGCPRRPPAPLAGVPPLVSGDMPPEARAVDVERRPVHRLVADSTRPRGVPAAVTEASLMTDEHRPGAEVVAAWATHGWSGDPMPAAIPNQIADRVHESRLAPVVIHGELRKGVASLTSTTDSLGGLFERMVNRLTTEVERQETEAWTAEPRELIITRHRRADRGASGPFPVEGDPGHQGPHRRRPGRSAGTPGARAGGVLNQKKRSQPTPVAEARCGNQHLGGGCGASSRSLP